MTDSEGQLELLTLDSATATDTASGEIVASEGPSARSILARYIDWHNAQFGVEMPKRQVGRAAKEIKRCLDANYPERNIVWGLCAWTSYLIDDPTKAPPPLDVIVYSMLMKASGHAENMRRARRTAGMPDQSRVRSQETTASIAASNSQVIERLYAAG